MKFKSGSRVRTLLRVRTPALRRRSHRRWRYFQDALTGIGHRNLFLLFVTICVAFAVSSCDKPVEKTTAGTTPYDEMRQRVVDQLQKGVLTPDASGVAPLPDDLKDAATDSRAIASRDPVLGWIVGFNLSVGGSSRAEYLLYIEKEPSEQTKSATIGAMKYTIGRKTRSHWYQAIRSA